MKDNLLPLRHILEAVNKIQQYATGKTFEQFLADPKLYDSILMNLIVIGEEANRVTLALKEKYPEIPWHEMVGMRNHLV